MTEERSGHANGPMPPPWTRFDTIAICVMLIVSLVAHFWRLGEPNVFVYDEHLYVEEAYKYLRGEAFFEVHPPLAILLIAMCTWVFGCHSWSWRIPSAVIGTALIPITYLLARRMFYSRGAATLATLLVLCEGMFLIYSRLALINIVYVTLGAASYLALFRFMQGRDSSDRRRSLAWLGVSLGLGLGSKLAIPGITGLLTVGFLVGSLVLTSSAHGPTHESHRSRDLSYVVGAVALVSGISGFFFFLTFLPNYVIGWWTGISSLTSYYHRVALANQFYPSPPGHEDSPWWSWPLLLRAYNYSHRPDDLGRFFAIWGGGNPAIWWAALVAIVFAGVRALQRNGVAWTFLSIGYLMYTAMWIPVHRAVYVYGYMPALYLGILALAGLLDACWRGTARVWEQSAILVPVLMVALLGLGYLYGAIASSLALGGYVALRGRGNWPGRFVCTIFVATSIAVFLYFLPLWVALPMTESAANARMWLDQAGLGKWM